MIIGGSRIGVLGGIGPEASGEFYNRLIKRLQEKGLIKSNIDFPQIIINSIPAPELIYDKISNKELQPYIKGLKELDNFRVDFIVMVCNTIYLYYDKLQKEIRTPILDLRLELKKVLKKKRIKSVLILGTPNTIKQGLYRFKGIKSFEPDKKELKQLTKAIFNFNKGINKKTQINKVKKICNKYQIEGAETIILGCTEFAVMLKPQNSKNFGPRNQEIRRISGPENRKILSESRDLLRNEDFNKIDTIDVLVDATIKRLISQY